MKFILDQGVKTCPVIVIVCECGWRSIASSQLAAHQRIAWHESRTHPGEKNARNALNNYKKTSIRLTKDASSVS